MTNDDLLKLELSERLFYGVKVQVDSEALGDYDSDWKKWCFEEEPQNIDGVLEHGVTFDCLDVWDGWIPYKFVKPYLYPLSSLTEKDLEEISCRTNFCIDNISKGSIELGEFGNLDDVYGLLEELRERHIDFRDLISMDLAIDASNLKIYEE